MVRKMLKNEGTKMVRKIVRKMVRNRRLTTNGIYQSDVRNL